MAQFKADISDFQADFLSSDSYSNNVHENWEKFKQAIINAIAKIYHSPCLEPPKSYRGSLIISKDG